MVNDQKTDYKKIVELALDEDLQPWGDLSSALFSQEQEIRAVIQAKENGVLACSELILEISKSYSRRLAINPESISCKLNFQDAELFKAGDIIAEITGPAITLLGAERSILNFLQRLCGIASASYKLTELIKDYPTKLLDTRKTMPGMRSLEKLAFRCGGGTNHRFNLSTMVMLKENHLAVVGLDLMEAIKSMRLKLDAKPETKDIKIEVEINQTNLAKLEQILEERLPVDIIMLDNFSAQEAKTLISKIRALSPEPRALSIEISGGINETNIIDYAKAGPDYISTGSVFTKANNIDLSFLVIA